MFAVYGETVLCAGQKVDGWTGYTWETNLFPNPANFLGSIKEVFMSISPHTHTTHTHTHTHTHNTHNTTHTHTLRACPCAR
jgi:hypothetical protein